MPPLVDLLRQHEQEIIDRWVERIRETLAPRAMDRGDLIDSLQEFLIRLAEAVELEVSGRRGEATHAARIAREHARQRFELGYDMASTIREYGILRDVLFDVAEAHGGADDPRETRALARCFFDVVAECAARYAAVRDEAIRRQSEQHVGFLAHELRNATSTAQMAVTVLHETGVVPPGHRAGAALQRSLDRLRDLIDDALVQFRLRAGSASAALRTELAGFLREIVRESTIDAESKRVAVETIVRDGVTLDIDRKLITSAVSNLVRNAIKFSHAGGSVKVEVKEHDDAIVIEVEDSCGGLPLGAVEKLFDPFVQVGTDRSGFGLGLAIARQAVEAHGGALRVHDLPGKGCVFVMDLPKVARAPASRAE